MHRLSRVLACLTVCAALLALDAGCSSGSVDQTGPGESKAPTADTSPSPSATSYPGTSTPQTFLNASVAIPDKVPFEVTEDSFQPTVIDKTWLLKDGDDYQCAIALGVWFNARGWEKGMDQAYTGANVKPGVTVVTHGKDPKPIAGTNTGFLAKETGGAGVVTPAFKGPTTSVHRVYFTPDQNTHVDLDVTALDSATACNPDAIAASLTWDGTQYDTGTWTPLQRKYAA